MPTEFATLPLSPMLVAVLDELGFQHMTPIQGEALPGLLSGRDMVAQAPTGSGKTAAFALPLLQRIEPSQRELSALVLCPTRELSAQVAREIRRLGRKHAGLSVLVLAGGEAIGRQRAALERGVHIAVGTPGRVHDQLRRRALRVHAVSTVVLDEADRMLEMGFQEDMDGILKAMPKQRQTVFFSATYPSSIEALCRKHQTDPLFVTIANPATHASEISEFVVRAEPDHKLAVLRSVLDTYAPEAALVFANLKLTVADVARALRGAGIAAEGLHGDLEQHERDRVLAKFRNASTRVLVATDVAARGIDIADLDLVVNFDLPAQPELYVHRIGRTGRAGKTGLAVSLASARDGTKLSAIERFTGRALTPSARPSLARAQPPSPSNTLERDAKMATLRISGGRKEKLRPSDILGALTGEAGGLSGSDVGKIEIHDHFAYVAVSKHLSRTALQSLSDGRIKGRRFQITIEE